jgi:hypothetical protein
MIYTYHARKQMREREISKDEVESIVRNYDTCVPALDDCRNYFKRFQNRKLRVTMSPDGDEVVTVAIVEEYT